MASCEQQIRFEHWANSQSLKASHGLPEALSLVAHIVSISCFWAARVEGTVGNLDPWPTFTVPELETELRQLLDRWLRLSGCTAMGAQVRYESSDGESRSIAFYCHPEIALRHPDIPDVQVSPEEVALAVCVFWIRFLQVQANRMRTLICPKRFRPFPLCRVHVTHSFQTN